MRLLFRAKRPVDRDRNARAGLDRLAIGGENPPAIQIHARNAVCRAQRLDHRCYKQQIGVWNNKDINLKRLIGRAEHRRSFPGISDFVN